MSRACALLLAACVACAGSSGPTATEDASLCPDEAPSRCPAQAPSYREDIAPALASSCVVCHSATGGAGFSEATYAEVYAQRSAILGQVNGCLMPPNTYPLAPGQRAALLAWLVCGAPDN